MAKPLKAPLRSREERDRLVLQYRDLPAYVYREVNRVYNVSGRLGFDDGVGYGNLGLVRAAEIWDESRGLTFSTYAFVAIRQWILRGLFLCDMVAVPTSAYKKGERSPMWWRPTLNCVNGVPNDRCPVYLPPDPSDREVLWEAMEKLPFPSFQVIVLVYFCHWSQSRVADSIGYSREWVSQLHKRGLRQLRSLLSEGGNDVSLPQPTQRTPPHLPAVAGPDAEPSG